MPKRQQKQGKRLHKLLIMPLSRQINSGIPRRRTLKRALRWRGSRSQRVSDKRTLGKRETFKNSEFIDLLSEKSLCEEVDGKSFYGSGEVKKEEGVECSKKEEKEKEEEKGWTDPKDIGEKEFRSILDESFLGGQKPEETPKGESEEIKQEELKVEESDQEILQKRRCVMREKKEENDRVLSRMITIPKIKKLGCKSQDDPNNSFLGSLDQKSETKEITISKNFTNFARSTIKKISKSIINKMENMEKILKLEKPTGSSKMNMLSGTSEKGSSEESLSKITTLSQRPSELEQKEDGSSQTTKAQESGSGQIRSSLNPIPVKKESRQIKLPRQGAQTQNPNRNPPGHKFVKLKNLMEKFFLNQELCEDDLILDYENKLLFRKIVEKKNQFLPFGTEWTAESVMGLSYSTSQKRNEEKLKYVFKLTLKNMKKQYRPKHFHFCGEELQGEYQKTASDDKELGFYCYHFRDFLKGGFHENNLKSFPEKFVKGGRLNVEEIIQSCSSGHKHQEKNSQKKFLRSIEVINKDFVQALSLSESFMQEFRRFLDINYTSKKGHREAEIMGDVNDIYKESAKLIRRKVELKIKQWLKTWNSCDQDSPRFENMINAEFSRKKYKLPWTLTDVRSAVHTVSAFLKTGSVKRN
jgi:hypothetical protein